MHACVYSRIRKLQRNKPCENVSCLRNSSSATDRREIRALLHERQGGQIWSGTEAAAFFLRAPAIWSPSRCIISGGVEWGVIFSFFFFRLPPPQSASQDDALHRTSVSICLMVPAGNRNLDLLSAPQENKRACTLLGALATTFLFSMTRQLGVTPILLLLLPLIPSHKKSSFSRAPRGEAVDFFGGLAVPQLFCGGLKYHRMYAADRCDVLFLPAYLIPLSAPQTFFPKAAWLFLYNALGLTWLVEDECLLPSIGWRAVNFWYFFSIWYLLKLPFYVIPCCT